MPRLFFTPGYNTPESQSLIPLNLYINGNEQENFGKGFEEFDLTKFWTSNIPLNLMMKFDLDASLIYSKAGLSKRDKVLLILHTYSTGTKKQHRGSFTEIHTGENLAQIDIPAGEISDTLIVSASLTVKLEKNQQRKIGAPVINWSRLLTKSWTLKLSGSQSQTNVVVVDFSKNPRWKKSMWHVQIRKMPDLENWLISQQSNMLRVEVNKDYAELLLESQFQTLLATDIAIQALDDAIKNDEIFEFLVNEGDGDGSWSIFVKTLFQQIFPEGDINVRQKWDQNPEDIRTTVQNMMSISLELK